MRRAFFGLSTLRNGVKVCCQARHFAAIPGTPLPGQMQTHPLLISGLIERAAVLHGKKEIVSSTVEGPIHRYTYSDANVRIKKLANALVSQLGVKMGDRVGTLAVNGYRHFELYFAVSGSGMILHTINPRLFAHDMSFIMNHAEDEYIFLEIPFVPVVEKFVSELKTVKGFIVLTDKAHMPKTSLKNVMCYEDLIDKQSSSFIWPVFDETTGSSMCYTSGTTGKPKGVLYSHRSSILHSLALISPDIFSLSGADSLLPIVPMFHVNAWGLPYAAAMTGCKFVLPGARMDGQSVYNLLVQEGVTITAGVPTVFMGLLEHMEKINAKGLPAMKRLIIGGSAAPPSMIEKFEKNYNVNIIHAWGMTETSPMGAVSNPSKEGRSWEEILRLKLKQGWPPVGVELKILDDLNKPVAHDGKTSGRLFIRGNWILSSYYNMPERKDVDAAGWFDTGDVATIDETGCMHITDRVKDIIKSGGEWISSITLENSAMLCPGVAEAGAIGVPDPKWTERPLLFVVRQDRKSTKPTKEDVLSYVAKNLAKWQVPEEVIFLDELPHTATGKVLKMKLRELYAKLKQ